MTMLLVATTVAGWGVTLSDDDGDNVWTGSSEFDPGIGQFEYVVAKQQLMDTSDGKCNGVTVMVLTS